jgi:hypothetical protein
VHAEARRPLHGRPFSFDGLPAKVSPIGWGERVPTTEHTINDAIAKALRPTRRAWLPSGIAQSEPLGQLTGNAKRPDILIAEAGVSPVVVENEILPAVTVEHEAQSRLGQTLRTDGRTILSAIALRCPDRFRALDGAALEQDILVCDDLEFAMFTGTSPQQHDRWPKQGWLKGDIRQLSLLIQAATVPPAIVHRAAERLMIGVQQAAGQLAGIENAYPTVLQRIAETLCQEDSEQTRRMAAAILADAFVFHESLAHGPGDLATIRNLEELKSAGHLTREQILNEWNAILKVNYWPIFDIAKRIFELVPANYAKPMAETLASTAAQLVENSLTRSHDLTGAVFQQLIVDRKFLAAFYTTPSAAALMVGLALDPLAAPNGSNWSDVQGLGTLKIGDFACGTGTLLSTAYSRLGQTAELHGVDSEALHPAMMSSALVGADVLPAAAHLTAAMLSGAHPRMTYSESHIMTVPYGPGPKGRPHLGSLDLLASQQTFDAVAATGLGAKGATKKDIFVSIPHGSFDLVVMNPPFTRPTGQEAKKIGVPNPMFAAFGAAKNEQKEMGKALDKLLKSLPGDHCFDGQAGEASAFIELADRKLKPGGRVGLITPLSLMSGEAWDRSRKKLAENYTDVVLASIAAKTRKILSFSADTGMAEAMFVGTKCLPGEQPTGRATYVVLDDRPTMPLDGFAAADAVKDAVFHGDIRSIDDGPFGGTAIRIGNDVIGHALDAPLPADATWDICRIGDLALAQAAWKLINGGILWLPGMPCAHADALPLRRIGDMIAWIGPYHADINWNGSGGSIRGPFKLKATSTPKSVTYPILWAHDAECERTLVFPADNEGLVRPGKGKAENDRILEKVNDVMASASHLHFNQNFRFNSQSTAMQFTPRRSIGGRAWLSLRFADANLEAAVALWGNTSLGLLLHWWQANKQQSGRGNIGKQALAKFVCLDPLQLSSGQLAASRKLLDQFADIPFKPFNEIDGDENRAKLDRAFLIDILGLPVTLAKPGGALDLLRAKLAREPSIHGSKKSVSSAN